MGAAIAIPHIGKIFSMKGEEDAPLLTIELINANPLKALIDIKKLVRKLPTDGNVNNILKRQTIIKMIESYDNGFIAQPKQCTIALKNILKEIIFGDFITYNEKELLLYLVDESSISNVVDFTTLPID